MPTYLRKILRPEINIGMNFPQDLRDERGGHRKREVACSQKTMSRGLITEMLLQNVTHRYKI